MGLTDLYPFLLSSKAIEKLAFVHELTHDQAGVVPLAAKAAAETTSLLVTEAAAYPPALGC